MVSKDDSELVDKYAPPQMPSLWVLTNSDPIWFNDEFTIDSLAKFMDLHAPTSKELKPDAVDLTK